MYIKDGKVDWEEVKKSLIEIAVNVGKIIAKGAKNPKVVFGVIVAIIVVVALSTS